MSFDTTNENPLIALRNVLAKWVHDNIDLDPVLAAPPAQPQAGSAFVRPSTSSDYIDFTNADPRATFCRTPVALSVVILGPSIDWSNVHDWFDDHVLLLRLKLRTAEWSGPGSRPKIIGVSQPGLMEGTQLMAVEIKFTPILLELP